METTTRTIHEIAKEIASDWHDVHRDTHPANPYLKAMFSLNTVIDAYGMDSADSIIRYFLGNSSSWRGETARRIKKELNAMIK
jgi:hypothetical protein